MKILNKIPTLEVKRCFVVGDLMAQHYRKTGTKRKAYIFVKKVCKMNEPELDKFIGDKYMKRLNAYNNSNWYKACLGPSELGVWRRAGELPLRWTNKSLENSASSIGKAMKRKNGFKNKKIRAVKSISSMITSSLDDFQKEKYLLPIVFQTDTGTRGRARLKFKTKGDIDDGCMRSIALTISGAKEITVYYGIPK